MKDIKEIKLENVVVREWDDIYCKLLKQILSSGEITKNRTGIDTLSVEGVSFKLDVGKCFPILESKKVLVKNSLSEMLWIYQAQSNKVSWLRERSNNIWDEWEVDNDGIYRIYEPCSIFEDRKVTVKDLNGKPLLNEIGKPVFAESIKEGRTIKDAKFFGLEYAGTIGTAYGWINNRFKRPQYVLEQLKKNPTDRRMLISLWQDEYIKTAVLPSCVWSNEWKVSNGKLHCFVHQRSADVPLGLPFNVTQYAILQSMFAAVSNLEVGNLNWSIMDAHVYLNQKQGVETQIKRYDMMKKYENSVLLSDGEKALYQAYNDLTEKYKEIEKKQKQSLNFEKYNTILFYLKERIDVLELMITKEKPALVLASKDNFFDFNNSINNDKAYLKENPSGNEDIKIKKYTSAPFIKMPIAQ